MKKDGMVKCKRCKGKGKVHWKTTDLLMTINEEVTCPDCRGKGKIDWIENIVGEKNRSMYRKLF